MENPTPQPQAGAPVGGFARKYAGLVWSQDRLEPVGRRDFIAWRFTAKGEDWLGNRIDVAVSFHGDATWSAQASVPLEINDDEDVVADEVVMIALRRDLTCFEDAAEWCARYLEVLRNQ